MSTKEDCVAQKNFHNCNHIEGEVEARDEGSVAAGGGVGDYHGEEGEKSDRDDDALLLSSDIELSWMKR